MLMKYQPACQSLSEPRLLPQKMVLEMLQQLRLKLPHTNYPVGYILLLLD